MQTSAFVILISCFWAKGAPASAKGPDATPPRFALAVGQELHYKVRSGVWFDGPDGKPNIAREKDGKVQGIFAGYSPTLRDDLAFCIREALGGAKEGKDRC